MTLAQQIALGSSALMICTFVHLGVLAGAVLIFRHLANRNAARKALPRSFGFLCTGILAILLGHTIQIWAWSAGFMALDIFETFEENFYYATVTYTTLGYGDLVAEVGLRVLATFASITGLLSFGISTAFLLGLIARLFSVFDV